ncbi:MAG: histidine--tRNA ligase [Gemmataceae bacterium]
MIQPRTLKGFRDYPPELMIPREWLMDAARRVYRSYGFAPIDTPALEYAEILVGKMDADTEIQRQLYRFKDNGDRDVAMRFDLTVPLARFVAQHAGQLTFPFKRYHIAPVWRGENTQAGRYREFAQCDFDTIGTLSNAADIETALVIDDLMVALGFSRFVVRVNNRLVLNGLLEEIGLADKAAAVLTALDKLAKQGRAKVLAELTESVGLTADAAGRVVALAETKGTSDAVLAMVERDFGKNAKAAEGVARLRELVACARACGIPDERLQIDLSICRGLDYYTGTIYETFLTDLPGIGSVCSGGRYDNLASLYTKQVLPGVGASLGLDRLLAAMEELKLLPKAATPAAVLVVQFAADGLAAYQAMARSLRLAGIATEVYPEAKKIGPQLQYAEKKGFRVAVIAGPDELGRGECKVKVLATREERTIPQSELAATVRGLLEPPA